MTEVAEQIARAVLYEGYLLYPYRPSAVKNQRRWNFGVLYPSSWAAAQTGSDRSYFRMETVALCSADALVSVSIRFLQLLTRDLSERRWQEAVEQRVEVPVISCAELAKSRSIHERTFCDGDKPVSMRLEASAHRIRKGCYRIWLEVHNTSPCAAPTRDEVLLCSLASAHAVLHLEGGEFVSQIDPPESLQDVVAVCQNVGVWPVLVGCSSKRDTMLGSPIILYDYPQIAPESNGDLFDATEIDEILTLRVLTLTDKEKEEMRQSDARARDLLERLEAMAPEQLLELHGAVRGMNAAKQEAWSAWDTIDSQPLTTAVLNGTEVKKGDRVRLRPRNRADIFDTFLDGKIAVVEAVEQDFEGRVQFAVVLEDDPGRDLGQMRQAGHRFFFSIDEVELVP